ncbi:MAG: S-methyl-5-thioribose-1-phosphate isomerase [Elusimicrobiales bacterium]|nr:S-methyl-5-thioribose-1-phosphate isomerase [Elusimicrobiales bacterium]
MIPKRIIYSKGKLRILDQRYLPFKINYFLARNSKDTAKAIKEMVVRGAPLIGDTAALGYLLGIDEIILKGIKTNIKEILKKNLQILTNSRPTAVSLFKTTQRLHQKAIKLLEDGADINEIRKEIEKEAFKIIDEDIQSTLKIAENGVKLLSKDSKVITYCNTGSLATSGIGTALGIILEGYKKGKISHVYPCETRPYLQGARLTTWELMKNKIPYTLICDNTAGWLMKNTKIDAVIIGADRIALNGDTANKIGSYTLAIVAKKHNIPFYVAAPLETFDLSISKGEDIKIEERSSLEIIKIKETYIAHPKTNAYHPAFDITPHNLISAIITEKGIIKNPNQEKIKNFLKKILNLKNI